MACLCVSVCTACLPARGSVFGATSQTLPRISSPSGGKGRPPLHPLTDPVPHFQRPALPQETDWGDGPRVWERWRVGEVARFHREIDEWTGRESLATWQWAGERRSFEKRPVRREETEKFNSYIFSFHQWEKP